MERQAIGGRALAWKLLVFLVSAGAGCCYLHPIHAPQPEILASCQSLPRCCKDHIHIFLLNGLDPMNYGNLTGLRDYVQSLGFHQTYYGQIYHYWWFRNQIRRIHREDPEAHFVLVGFSIGVNLADALARSLKAEGVYFDTIVFLSGNHPLAPMPSEPPANAGRVVNILASGLMGTRGERDWAEDIRLADSWHFDTPSHVETLEKMAEVLAQVGEAVPEVISETPPAPAELQPPTPRPVRPQPSAKRDEWDFLKPVSRQREVKETASAGSKESTE
jgi:hypothetical protein